jgi:hypothetical protein
MTLESFLSASRASRRPPRRMCGRPLACKIWRGDFSGVRSLACMCPACLCSEGCWPRWFPRAGDPNNPIQRPRLAVASCGLSPVADRTISSIFPSLARSSGEPERRFEPADLVRWPRWPRRGARSARRSPSASKRSAPSCWRAPPPRAWRACAPAAPEPSKTGFSPRPGGFARSPRSRRRRAGCAEVSEQILGRSRLC